mgnify:CR=1 FL=1
MKIIDLLNLKAEGKLEDDFTFVFDNKVWTYNKKRDEIYSKLTDRDIGQYYCLENNLNDKIYPIKEEK